MNSDEGTGADWLAILMRNEEQAEAAGRSAARLLSSFFNELVSQGVPTSEALYLTNAYMNRLWPPPAIMLKMPDDED